MEGGVGAATGVLVAGVFFAGVVLVDPALRTFPVATACVVGTVMLGGVVVARD